jgi:integration host factor subunit alpha
VTLTKADLIEAVYERLGFPKKEAAHYVELVFEVLKESIIHGKKVKISGFGNFVVREKRARMGRNPQTGENIQISQRKVLTFRPSQVLREQVNASLKDRPILKEDVQGRAPKS